MTAHTAQQQTTGQTAMQDEPLSGSGVQDDVLSLWHELRGLSHDYFRLAALETRRAGDSLVTMIIAGVMIAVLLNSAWLGFVAAIALKLIEHGIVASNAILLAVAVNLLFALILYGVLRRKSRYLQFPATVRSLQPVSPSRRDAE